MTDGLPLRHAAAVELLDRALSYTRGTLMSVREEHLGRRTPCARWSLDALLAHMDDSLDAFTEGAAGQVDLAVTGAVATRVATLQRKACALLGAWSDPGVARWAAVGEIEVDTTYLALAAALEITAHGWDVARATGADTPVPDDLASRLVPVARSLVGPADRGSWFADPALTPRGASPAEILLAHLGRRSLEPASA